MEEEKQYQLYETDGSVAYRIYETRADGTTAVKPAHVELPEEVREPEKKQVVKAKIVISPFAAIGLVVVVALLAMVIYGYVQFYELTNQLGEINSQITANNNEISKKESFLESKINLAEVEARAKEMGMRMPTARQKVYVNVPGADRTEVYQVDNRNAVERTWEAISDSFRGILEYFR